MYVKYYFITNKTPFHLAHHARAVLEILSSSVATPILMRFQNLIFQRNIWHNIADNVYRVTKKSKSPKSDANDRTMYPPE